ncbi:class I SAM-dependent methyltransferase [Estrella lausannensis]|uniref:Putative methyltransferase n=1 Tax=Estrella lausannensis TaxID=483423 RepID=A0A0H5DRJ4_9BACT|nr:hypothetical protein [Estrella lausannensis]CRX38314.1 Putative methyltransferase [Estrella lausannensis]
MNQTKDSKPKKTAENFQCKFENIVVKPLQELSTFFHQFIDKPRVIGALTPSSPFLGKAIARRMRREIKANRRLLEIGAGTGVVTKLLIHELNPGDHLDVIECVPDLIPKLRAIIDSSGKSSQVTLHELLIEDFHPPKKYDQVISGLPLTMFPPEQVVAFYSKLENELLEKEGLFTYYEYLALPELRLCYYTLCRKIKPDNYTHLRKILKTKNSFLKEKQVESDTVWFNITPLRVIHVRQ